ncbi:MAG: hypothetical protein PHE24_04120 [Patescibacteria group bacterium]|nr:hypothetical protein [Patescibacteria group bacterium]
MTALKAVRYLVIGGDMIYILWILYNGLNEGWRDIASVQAVVLLGLIILLGLNIILIYRRS